MKDCWLRCDICSKWRLVEKGALASLTGETYKEVTECAKDPGWKAWLGDAEKRYGLCLETHRKQQVAEGVVEEEEPGFNAPELGDAHGWEEPKLEDQPRGEGGDTLPDVRVPRVLLLRAPREDGEAEGGAERDAEPAYGT